MSPRRAHAPLALLAPPLFALLSAALVGCGEAPRDGAPPHPPAPPASAAWRPNVLVVTLDTTRADALGCYGATHGYTPTLDALAARGIRFAAARAPTPVTMPSHATIFTGSYPFQHGVRDNGTFVLGDGAVTLAERLRDAGYATAAIPAAFVVDSSFGLAQGFERYDDLSLAQSASGGEGEERSADEVVERAQAFLAAHDPSRPFFLWTHFFDPHFPYAPPAALQAAHPFDDQPQKKGNTRAKLRHLYELELAHLDAQFAQLLAALEPFGGAAETLIVVVGDHGEGLGDHGEASHATFVYDSTLAVPLLIAHARLPAGRVVDTAVSSVDVTPTVVALLGLPQEGTFGAPLAPLWEGAPFEPQRAIYFENCSTWFTSGWAPLFGVVEGRWKTIVGPEIRLFDVVADPDEKRDVAAAHPEIVEAARARLADYAEQTLAAARHAPDADELAALQRLGYVQSSESSRRGGLAPPGWQPKGALTPEQGLANQKRFTEANQLWQRGQKGEAIEQLLALAREEPENSHYAEIAAALLYEMGRAAEALPLVERAVELSENVGNRATLAACLFAVGRKEESLQALAATVEKFPRTVSARFSWARALLDAGRREEALAALAPLEQQLPADAPLRAQLEALQRRARGG